jgi:hypothetical protein
MYQATYTTAAWSTAVSRFPLLLYTQGQPLVLALTCFVQDAPGPEYGMQQLSTEVVEDGLEQFELEESVV